MYPLLSVILFSSMLFSGGTTAPTCARVKAQPDLWIAAKVDALVAAAHAAYQDEAAEPAYDRVVGDIAGTMERCGLSKDEDFTSRYAEFTGYVEALAIDQKPDHELGFVVPDKQYFDETGGFVQIPEFLTNQSFLRLVSRFQTLEQAKAYLRRLNSARSAEEQLIFFSYNSRHLGTPDSKNSFGRLLVVVPGDASKGVPEKWVQFGVPDPGARARVRNVSVVSSLAAGDGTSSVYFKDFYRTYRADGSITIKGRWELGYGDDNCAQCHKSGVLPIFPEAGSVRADEKQAVEAVNERFRTYGPPNFGKYLDETKFGPGLGSASWDARERLFGASFGGTTVARSMICSTCHKPDGLGAFNWPMDSTILSSYVEGGQMPFGSKLDKAERTELYERLVREYFSTDSARPGILKSWLLGRLRESTPPS
ncbi:MAG TPA: hypothetical protein VLJ61_13145 [Pyrinomonadaceae bacterium]|nr:hypothetical protein [Pyrinomonadaceae bacterium]